MDEDEKRDLPSEDYYLGVMEALTVAWRFMPDYQQPTAEQVKKLISALDRLESDLEMKWFGLQY